jgi:hypothetical protein
MALAVALVGGCVTAAAQDGPVPDAARPAHHLFPGKANPAVTQANINSTICKAGWTDTIRPPTSYTTALKKIQMTVTLHYTTANPLPKVKSASGTSMIPNLKKCKPHSANTQCWEEDHLISLQLGGAPRDPDNLWPEPWFGPWNARVKDALETRMKRMVCSGEVTLSEAQTAISTDWVAAYKKYVPHPPG